MQHSERQGGFSPDAARKKESHDVAVDVFVREAIAHEWQKLDFDQLRYEDVWNLFDSIRIACEGKFLSQASDKNARAERMGEIVHAVLTEVTLILPPVVSADIFDVIADTFSEAKSDVLAFALDKLPATAEFAQRRSRFLLNLYHIDKDQFAERFALLSAKEQVNAARAAATADRISLFVWYEKMGISLDEATMRKMIEDEPRLIASYAKAFKRSSEQIRAFLDEFDPWVQDEARRALQIPIRWREHEEDDEDEPKAKRIHIESEVAREHEIDVERMKALSDRLAEAIATAFPEQAERVRSGKEKERTLFGEIERYGELSGGMNSPLFVYLKDVEHTPAVYKPQRRENPNLRDTIPAGTYAAREWLAYQIDQSLQIGTTPVTILRKGLLGVGSVQEWKVGRNASRGRYENAPNPDQLEDLVFDDVVKQNTDRHGQNVIVGYDGSVSGIDHGLIFSEDEAYWVICSPGYEFRGKEPSERVQNRVKQFRAAEEVKTILRECFDAALGNAAKGAWEKFEYGMDFLSPTDPERSPRFPYVIKRAAFSQQEFEKKERAGN